MCRAAPPVSLRMRDGLSGCRLNYILRMVGGHKMAKQSGHVQCKLRRGSSEMTAWIPNECALEGRVVDLDDPEHGETKGWTVLSVGSMVLDSDVVRERSRDYLTQRKASDL